MENTRIKWNNTKMQDNTYVRIIQKILFEKYGFVLIKIIFWNWSQVTINNNMGIIGNNNMGINFIMLHIII